MQLSLRLKYKVPLKIINAVAPEPCRIDFLMTDFLKIVLKVTKLILCQRDPYMVQWSAITALEFVTIFKQVSHNFHFALGPTNCVIGPA